ncbi:hypothetical protein [Phenylobacterium sp.]|uniref:hypothetical protein n=1 Tax=Phenylobacterium sp. TaxID=1871053 RepID=UPI002F4144C7
MIVALILSGCSTPAPRLGRGLPSNFAAASRAFDERIQARFPVGSPESRLRDELTAEHFKIDAVSPAQASGYQFSAQHGGGVFPACDLTWTVMWAVEAGRIARIGATYYATCL